MTTPIIHPDWDKPPRNMVDGYSLEITAKDADSLREASPTIPPATQVSVTFLPGEEADARVAAAKAVRGMGFEPMPHFSARRIQSEAEFTDYLQTVIGEAQVKRCFVIAGDPDKPQGPYADSSALIATGAFEKAGIEVLGVGGHPEGHPNMTDEQCLDVLAAKTRAIKERGMVPLVVTQFTFDAEAVLAWLLRVRERGIDAPVRVGVPGPAGIKTLVRFAARCGVGASASVMAKYGVSLTHLLGSAGPDKLVDAFQAGLTPAHGPVRLHFYPFGGLAKTVGWVDKYRDAH